MAHSIGGLNAIDEVKDIDRRLEEALEERQVLPTAEERKRFKDAFIREWNKRLIQPERPEQERPTSAGARCFRQESLPKGRANLTLEWDGSSHLTRVRVVPAVSESTEKCIRAQVGKWDLPVPPTLQAFSFSQEVILSQH